jgi:hypothetical protein
LGRKSSLLGLENRIPRKRVDGYVDAAPLARVVDGILVPEVVVVAIIGGSLDRW